MTRIPFTEAESRFLIDNINNYTNQKLGEMLGRPRSSVATFYRRNGMKKAKEAAQRFRAEALMGRTSSTSETDEILRKYYLKLGVKPLAKKVGRSSTFVKARLRQLGLVVPKEIIEQRKKDSQIKKGNIPFNKGRKLREVLSPEGLRRSKATRFKKGHLPHNTKYDGATSVRLDKRTGRKYRCIRLGLRRWDLYARYVWRKHHGAQSITTTDVIIHIDGNSLNDDISNLKKISYRENMSRNSIVRYPEEVRSLIHLNSKLKKVIQNAEK